jgi:iron complex outermembrane receptor protein
MNRIAVAVKSALGLALLAPPALTFAATASDTSNLEEIVVTGIRKSVEQSLEAKRDSTELTEVVTSEDIRKMPDKNVADSLARLPGVTTSAARSWARSDIPGATARRPDKMCPKRIPDLAAAPATS